MTSQEELIISLRKELVVANASAEDSQLQHEASVEVNKRLGKRNDYLESIVPVKFKSRTTGREWRWVAEWENVTETSVK